MFVVLLEFSGNKSLAGQHMDGHVAWLQRGLEEGAFLVAGNLQPHRGGAILARNMPRPELERRLDEDPFIAHGVVSREILEITPSKAVEELRFLLG